MMIFSALINNITLIVALSILYRFIIRRWASPFPEKKSMILQERIVYYPITTGISYQTSQPEMGGVQ